MTTYSDGRVLNSYADGTSTMTDAQGTLLNPATGSPIGRVPPAVPVEDVRPDDIEIGIHIISTLAEATAIIARAEAVASFLEPINAMLAPIVMAIEVYRSLEASVRAYGIMGYSYGLVYGALDQGEPAYPEGDYSLDAPDVIRDKRGRYADGAAKATDQLQSGSDGAALRNRILLRTAFLQGNAQSTLNEIWRAGCENGGDDFYAEHFSLKWPSTGMTEA